MTLKVLILGNSGMAGSMIYHYLRKKGGYDLTGISRTQVEGIPYKYYDLTGIDVNLQTLLDHDYDYIINCVGVLVRESEENKPRAVLLNSRLPHLIASLKPVRTKLIHLSTDCVFNGKSGGYAEEEKPNADDFYGRAKALGEVIDYSNLNLRMSIMGPEVIRGGSLFDWFVHAKGSVKGYTNVLWNGITTLELATQLDIIMKTQQNLVGIYHLVPPFYVAKVELLRYMKKYWNKDVEVIDTAAPKASDKVLLNKQLVKYDPKISSYEIQFQELCAFMSEGGIPWRL